MVIESKLSVNRKPTPRKVLAQVRHYAPKLNTLYTVVAGLIKDHWSLIIMRGRTTMVDNRYDSWDSLLRSFVDFFTNNVAYSSLSQNPVSFDSLINTIQRSPTYESFLRAEFFRAIRNLGLKGVGWNHYYPVSDCSVISEQRLSETRADLVVFRDESTASCDYPLLVLKFFKSYFDLNPTHALVKHDTRRSTPTALWHTITVPSWDMRGGQELIYSTGRATG